MGRFNLIQPSLIQQLKTILDQYQDDGQILKELIQNAEDAGASHVKFLYDETSYSANPSKLHHPDLAAFQGPALYAYNDAVFTDEDWVGLKMLSDSVKKNDPMKVGRFGLGFKSVFHMTDIPIVLSGNKVGVIDPHEKYFQEDGYRTTGYMWHLREDKDEIRKIPDQFAPFRGVFDCTQRTFDIGSYKGTLFRFPLRQTVSKLCDTLYTGDKVDGLFMCFQRIAHFIPLFLSSVETVEIYERLAKDKEPRLRFRVCLSKNCVTQVRTRRKDFIDRVLKLRSKSESVSSSFLITIETVLFEKKSKSCQTNTFLVTHCFKGGKFSDEMKDIMYNSDITFTPRVGVAVRIPEEKRDDITHADPEGHVFCFLPLPLHKRSQTGLPCHVNGFFAVSQNRQFLKWPTTDQGAEKLVLDKACIWNQCVLREIVPDVYVELLLNVISEMKQGKLPTLTHQQFYEMIPDPSAVDEKWKLTLKPFFEQLLSKPILYSTLKKGQWMKVDNVIVDAASDDQSLTRKVAVDSLLLANEHVASIPKHIVVSLDMYWGREYKRITPSFMREKLKSFTKYKQYGWREKLSLLLYCLLDDSYSEIEGLELLPLADGSFAKFSKSERPVFLAGDAHPMSIVPGLEKNFMDPGLESRIYDRLTCLDCIESTQLKDFNEEHVLDLLPDMYPTEWCSKQVVAWTPDSNKDHPPYEWLENFWVYSKENFSSSLSRLEDFHLIPYTRDGKLRITRLKTTSPKILRITEGATIDANIADILRTLGVIVVEELPDYLKEISASLYDYVLPPTILSVIKVLQKLADSSSLEKLNEGLLCKVSPESRKALRSFLSRASSTDLDSTSIHLLSSLSLFTTMSRSSKQVHFVRSRDVSTAAPSEVQDLPPGVTLLDISEPDAMALAKLLGVRLLNMPQYLKEIVFPLVRSGDVFKPEDVVKNMTTVLKNLAVYQQEDPEFANYIRDIPFVRRTDGNIVCPADVFDPDISTLQSLFATENVFPSKEFTSPQLLISLREVGLKGVDDVTARDVLSTATCIETLSVNAHRKTTSSTAITEKSKALGEILCKNLSLLNGEIDSHCLKDKLADINWVIAHQATPGNYPTRLKWFKGDIPTEKPSRIKSDIFASIIGSVIPTIGRKTLQPLHSVFDWDKQPNESDIALHLLNVVESYSSDEKAAFMILVGHIYDTLSQRDHDTVKRVLTDNNVIRWVWHGDGFVDTCNIVVNTPFIELRPYLYSLPPETGQYVSLFKACGVEECLTDDTQLRVLNTVKHKYDATRTKHAKNDVSRDLHIVSSIVNKFGSEQDKISSDVINNLLLPVHTESDSRLEMALASECTYCEAEWLKERHDVIGSSENEVRFVHPAIPNHVAEALGVPTLMSRMLDTDAFEIGESFGQSEPLTTRLHRLLEDYKDGFAVPKELIQNADDAGATEVKFLYDERKNEDCLTCLIDEGMRECQGPALWVYNNAVFTDTDFENIIKLSGATKEKETEKIGGFGLGFNAVYNLTDVPSFLSRHYLVIFDPHLHHLGKGISDATKPGIKIDMAKNRKCLTSLGNQFKPYQNVFGCNVQPQGDETSASFDGTLFRFPLRTKEQALKSDISSLFYDRKNVVELFDILAKGIDSLLLFTQNVSKVTVYHLPSHEKNPDKARVLFSVSKAPHSIVNRHNIPITLSDVILKLSEDQQDFYRQCNTLKACSVRLRHLSTRRPSEVGSSISPNSSLILQMHTVATDQCTDFFQGKIVNYGKQLWLVSSVMGDERSLKMALYEIGLIPAAGVAVRLFQVANGKYSIIERNASRQSQFEGSVFCFLPLPIRSGVPVHVNGAFAVTSNRRHLCQRLRDDKRDLRADWNEALMEDGVSKAFVAMLSDLKSIADENEYLFYSLWPLKFNDQISQEIVESVYQKICSESVKQDVFKHDHRWVSIASSVFLHPTLSNSSVANEALMVLNRVLNPSDQFAIQLPSEYFDAMVKSGCEDIMSSRTYTKERFYEDVFLPNINSIDACVRDKLLLFAIDDSCHSLDTLLGQHACISVTPDGLVLKHPRDLVNPVGKISAMYSPEDGRFPYNEAFKTPERLLRLTNIGMQTDDIKNMDIVERAKSIATLADYDDQKASERCKALLHVLDTKLRNGCDMSDITGTLVETKFLPTLRKPRQIPFSWAGDNWGKTLAPTEAYAPSFLYLVCCSHPIVDTSLLGPNSLPDSLKEFLRLGAKEITLEEAIKQLHCAREALPDADQEQFDEIRKTCFAVYRFLQEKCLHSADDATTVVDSLTSFKSIMTERDFVYPKQAAMSFPSDCSPYLNELPMEFQKFEFLMKLLGVKGHFEFCDFVETLATIYHKFEGKEVELAEQDIVINIARHLRKMVETVGREITSIEEECGTVYLLSTNGLMLPSTELCFNDCPWLPDDHTMKFVHQSIPYTDAKQLGVNTKRQDSLKRNSIGIPFGQKERLTKRLKRILTGYPCGKEVLKELLQNADDAKATKIHFIKDFRYHGDRTVFEECWKPLQGPALCVYNDSPFTKHDLEGIQNLGEGSKGEDPTKTGQYGVGFNAVYHLTDAPSFISQGEEIGEVLCAFDPHCAYVPGSTPDSPGRMFGNASDLRKIFSDVFEGYLDDLFPIENATMFRFPLRDRQMASDSKISNTQVSYEVLDKLLQTFRVEMFDSLLFLNNVEQISLSNIDTRNGALTDTYTVKLELSDEDKATKQSFRDHVKRETEAVKTKRKTVFDIFPREVAYTVTVRDSENRWEKWLITQRLGFGTGFIPHTVKQAITSGDISLQPRGGVAGLLSTSGFSRNRPKRPFCFLPLPVTVELPVHVNGHFALDHEARRNLWRDESGGYRTDWNMAILQHVVTPCYVKHLETFRMLQLESPMNENRLILSRTADEIVPCLKTFHELFPTADVQDDYWRHVAETFYSLVYESRSRLLPVLRPMGTDEVQLKWFAAKGRGDDVGFFDCIEQTLNEKRAFSADDAILVKDVLIATDCNLLECPSFIYENFIKLGLEVKTMSPTFARMFFKTFQSLTPLCDMPILPRPLKETPIRDLESLKTVLKYCLLDDDFIENLHGVPLLLCQDSNLYTFDATQSVILHPDYELVPNSENKFLHSGLHDIFTETVVSRSRCFKTMNIPVFSELLSNTSLDSDDFGKVTNMRWSPGKTQFPSIEWIQNVWSYLYRELTDLIENDHLDDDTKRGEIKRHLSSLADWNILPARTRTEQRTPGKFGKDSYECWLAPISMANSVIYFNYNDVVSHPLQDALSKLGLLELDVSIFEKSKHSAIRSSGAANLTKYITASLTKPIAVLATLGSTMSIRSLDNVLKAKEANTILKYFSDSLDEGHCQSETATHVLMSLPFYLTINNELISLADCTVYVLPPHVPSAEMDVWKDKSGIVFLQRNESVKTLHERLGCAELTDTQLYTSLIFEHLEYMSDEARTVHIRYIRETTLQAATDEEKCLLLSALRYLKFIPDVNGILRTATEFCDPENEIFAAMKSPDYFPPRPFNEFRWIRFLRLIGLVHEVTTEDFVQFAEEIARCAVHTPEDKDLRRKSKILVMELFKRYDVVTEGLLDRIRHVKFVAPSKVDTKWSDIVPQFETEGDTLSYISFDLGVSHRKEHEQIVWSSAKLLPQWADPLSLKDGVLSFDPDTYSSADDYQMAIVENLNIQEQPTAMQVIDHLSHICNHVKCLVQERSVDIKRNRHVSSVLNAIYSFLKNNINEDEEATHELQNMEFIISEDGRSLIKAQQIVISLYYEQQIKPYLYRAPPDLAEFFPLFEALGATTRATVTQYAMVLDGLHQKCGDSKLQPNELKAAYKAVNGLFSGLSSQSDQGLAALGVLYLPSEKAVLLPSCELVYNDEPSFTPRLVDFNKNFLVNLKECNLKAAFYGDLLRKLPKQLQCRMLSSLVSESLDSSCIEKRASYGTSQLLRNRLTSPLFGDAVVRLIRHEHQGQKISSKKLKAIKQQLKNVRVFGLETVRTFLQYGATKIKGSETSSDCFVKKIKENDEKIWCIYIMDSPDTTLGPELQVHVAEVIGRMTRGLLQEAIIYLSPILTCAVQNIAETLDKLRIRQDHSATQKQPTLAPPGDFIPLEDHHLLKEDFAAFEQDEYVGYELSDPSLQQDLTGEATFVYAIILDIVDCESDDAFMWLYRINVGDDRAAIVVPATDLYRFHRVETIARDASAIFERSQSFSEHIVENDDVADEEFSDEAEEEDGIDCEILDESTSETRYENQWKTPPESPTRERYSSLGSQYSRSRSASHLSDDQPDGRRSRTISFGRQTSSIDPGDRYRDARGESLQEEPGEVPNQESESQEQAEDLPDGGTFDDYRQPGQKSVKEELDEIRERLRKQYEEQKQGFHGTKKEGARTSTFKIEEPDAIPENIHKIKKYITHVLGNAYSMEEKERKKLIKRIFLKWHPDKNYDQTELATEVTQHIQSEINRLDEGGFRADGESDPAAWWAEFAEKRAKMHSFFRTQYQDDFQETFANTHEKYSYQDFNVPPSFTKKNPQPEEAKRWYRQARCDLDAAQTDLDCSTPAYEWSCYKCYQAAEKALTAAKYSIDTHKSTVTRLTLLASDLHDDYLREDCACLQDIIGDPTRLCYPDNAPFPGIPRDSIDGDTARDVFELTTRILESVVRIMKEHDVVV